MVPIPAVEINSSTRDTALVMPFVLLTESWLDKWNGRFIGDVKP